MRKDLHASYGSWNMIGNNSFYSLMSSLWLSYMHISKVNKNILQTSVGYLGILRFVFPQLLPNLEQRI